MAQNIATKNALEEIKFAQGDKELQTFPPHLAQVLEANLMNGGQLDCLRSFSRRNFMDEHDRPAHFEVQATQDPMFAACFKYGAHKQLVIAKEKQTRHINNGEAVIIVYVKAGVRNTNEGWTSTQYKIWNPVDTTDTVKPGILKKVQHLVKDSNTEISTPEGLEGYAARERPVAGYFSPTVEHDLNANELIEMTGQSNNHELDRTRQSLPSYASDRAKFPVAVSATSAQPKIAKRESSAFPSTSDDAEVPLSKMLRRRTFNSPLAEINSVPTVIAKHSDLVFEFKQSPSSPVQRTKSAKICNTVPKIFAHAQVAGIIDKSIAILSLSYRINDDVYSIDIVRDDPEDFNMFMSTLKDRDLASQVVVMVTPEEQDSDTPM